DGSLTDLCGIEPKVDIGSGGLLFDCSINPRFELTGGFTSEGHAEDFFGAHITVGDEPDDTVGHGVCLPRACPGNDEQRLGPGFDDRGLLIGGIESLATGLMCLEQIGQLSSSVMRWVSPRC